MKCTPNVGQKNLAFGGALFFWECAVSLTCQNPAAYCKSSPCLTKAKAVIPYGEWGKWLAKFGFESEF